MSKQLIKQQARRAALQAQATRRAERAERDKRLQLLAVRVLVAVRERDAAVADAEQRAGQALATMTQTEGLSMREALVCCGGELTLRDASRMRRLAAEPRDDTAGGSTRTQPRLSADSARDGDVVTGS